MKYLLHQDREERKGSLKTTDPDYFNRGWTRIYHSKLSTAEDAEHAEVDPKNPDCCSAISAPSALKRLKGKSRDRLKV
jgi:hypothetical protein